MFRKNKTKARANILTKDRLNYKDVENFFHESYSANQHLSPKSYTLDLNKEIDKKIMLTYFKDMEWTLQIAYKNTKKTEHLNIQTSQNERGSSIPADQLLEGLVAFKRVIEYLENSSIS